MLQFSLRTNSSCFENFLIVPLADESDRSPLVQLDKPNEQLAAVWALVPPTPPRPSPLPMLSRRHHLTPETQDVDAERRPQKGSRFAEFMSKKGAELAWKLPEYKDSQQGPSHSHSEELSYAARTSYPIHSRL